ncbi:hypothetical protein Tco_0604454, partial [Tanacetum coccineum]
ALALKKAEEEGNDIGAAIATSVGGQTIVAFIRHYEIEFHGQKETKIHVVKAYKQTNMSPLPNLPLEVGSASILPDPPERKDK